MKYATRFIALFILTLPALLHAAAAAPAHDIYAAERAGIRALLHDTTIHHRLDRTLERLALNPIISREEYHNLTEDEKEMFTRRLWAEYDQFKHVGAMHGFLTTIVGLSDRAATSIIDRVRTGGVSVMNRVIAPLLKKLVISNAPRGDAFWVHDDARMVTHDDIPVELLMTDKDSRQRGQLDNNVSMLDQALLHGVDGIAAAGRAGRQLYEASRPKLHQAYQLTSGLGDWLRGWLHKKIGSTAGKPAMDKKEAASTFTVPAAE